MELFGTTHLLTLLIGALFGAACIMARRRGHFWPVAILAFLNLSAYAYNQWVYVNLGHTIPLDNILPFHLCDIAAFLAGFALLTPRPLVRELCYYWGLAGTNFGFLMRKPEGATLFDHLGPWPYYLIWVQLLASAMIALFLLPFSKRINVWRFR